MTKQSGSIRANIEYKPYIDIPTHCDLCSLIHVKMWIIYVLSFVKYTTFVKTCLLLKIMSAIIVGYNEYNYYYRSLNIKTYVIINNKIF